MKLPGWPHFACTTKADGRQTFSSVGVALSFQDIMTIMPGNSFGELFRVTTAGVSHGPGYVAIVDGCPPGLPLSEEDLLPDLRRRRPGQSTLVTQRDEDDVPEI